MNIRIGLQPPVLSLLLVLEVLWCEGAGDSAPLLPPALAPPARTSADCFWRAIVPQDVCIVPCVHVIAFVWYEHTFVGGASCREARAKLPSLSHVYLRAFAFDLAR